MIMEFLQKSAPSPQHIKDVHNVMLYLQNMFSRYDNLCSTEGEKFRWLKTEPTPLGFADFVFAYKNQVFAVIVMREKKNEDGSSFGDPQKRSYLLQEARKNHLIPCAFFVYEEEQKSFSGKSFNLRHALRYHPIDPIEKASDKLIELSDWELKNWAVSIVVQYLNQEGYRIDFYTDDPGIAPNIWFTDENGKKCWVQVLYTMYPDNDKDFSFKKWASSTLEYDGYKAVVGFANAEDINSKLYRAKGAFVNFRGITPVHSGGSKITEEAALPVLSKEDFSREVDKLIELEGDLNLPEEILAKRTELLFILNRLMHYKLTVEELNDSFIFLMNLMNHNQPKLALEIQQPDRIRLPFAMLDNIAPTKGKLTREEKLVYAYCAYQAYYMLHLDENTGQMRRGINLLVENPDKIIAALKWEMKHFPEKFAFLKPAQNSKYPFAVTKQNPVKMTSINESYKYLSKLLTRECLPVRFERIGSMTGVNGGIIDGYNLFYDTLGETGIQHKTLTIYIDPYSTENSIAAPEGFILLPDEDVLDILNMAENGSALAQYDMGERFAHGYGVVEDYHAAFKWFMRAKLQGSADAENQIGIAYAEGLGVTKNLSKALGIFHSAAAKGCTQAHSNFDKYAADPTGLNQAPYFYF